MGASTAALLRRRLREVVMQGIACSSAAKRRRSLPATDPELCACLSNTRPGRRPTNRKEVKRRSTTPRSRSGSASTGRFQANTRMTLQPFTAGCRLSARQRLLGDRHLDGHGRSRKNSHIATCALHSDLGRCFIPTRDSPVPRPPHAFPRRASRRHARGACSPCEGSCRESPPRRGWSCPSRSTTGPQFRAA